MELSVFGIVLLTIQPKEDSSMIKIALAVAATAAVLTISKSTRSVPRPASRCEWRIVRRRHPRLLFREEPDAD
jgi:hypothetical protein